MSKLIDFLNDERFSDLAVGPVLIDFSKRDRAEFREKLTDALKKDTQGFVGKGQMTRGAMMLVLAVVETCKEMGLKEIKGIGNCNYDGCEISLNNKDYLKDLFERMDNFDGRHWVSLKCDFGSSRPSTNIEFNFSDPQVDLIDGFACSYSGLGQDIYNKIKKTLYKLHVVSCQAFENNKITIQEISDEIMMQDLNLSKSDFDNFRFDYIKKILQDPENANWARDVMNNIFEMQEPEQDSPHRRCLFTKHEFYQDWFNDKAPYNDFKDMLNHNPYIHVWLSDHLMPKSDINEDTEQNINYYLCRGEREDCVECSSDLKPIIKSYFDSNAYDILKGDLHLQYQEALEGFEKEMYENQEIVNKNKQNRSYLRAR